MQTPSPPLRIATIFMKDAHSTELNEKSIFWFSFFELWLIILFTIFKCFYRPNMVKIMSQKMCNVLKRIFVFMRFFCPTFSSWDIVDFGDTKEDKLLVAKFCSLTSNKLPYQQKCDNYSRFFALIKVGSSRNGFSSWGCCSVGIVHVTPKVSSYFF